MAAQSTTAARAVIDGDGHLMEDANLWLERMAPEYRHMAPRLVPDGDGARLMMDGRLSGRGQFHCAQVIVVAGPAPCRTFFEAGSGATPSLAR